MRSGSPAIDVESNVQTGCNYSQIWPLQQGLGVHVDRRRSDLDVPSRVAGRLRRTTKIGDNADKIFSTITVDSSHQVHIALSVRHNDDPVGFVAQCTVNNGNCAEKPQPTDLYW